MPAGSIASARRVVNPRKTAAYQRRLRSVRPPSSPWSARRERQPVHGASGTRPVRASNRTTAGYPMRPPLPSPRRWKGREWRPRHGIEGSDLRIKESAHDREWIERPYSSGRRLARAPASVVDGTAWSQRSSRERVPAVGVHHLRRHGLPSPTRGGDRRALGGVAGRGLEREAARSTRDAGRRSSRPLGGSHDGTSRPLRPSPGDVHLVLRDSRTRRPRRHACGRPSGTDDRPPPADPEAAPASRSGLERRGGVSVG